MSTHNSNEDRPTIPVPASEILATYEAMVALAMKRNAARRARKSPVPPACDRPTVRLAIPALVIALALHVVACGAETEQTERTLTSDALAKCFATTHAGAQYECASTTPDAVRCSAEVFDGAAFACRDNNAGCGAFQVRGATVYAGESELGWAIGSSLELVSGEAVDCGGVK